MKLYPKNLTICAVADGDGMEIIMVRRDIKTFSIEGLADQVMLEAPFSLASAIEVGKLSLADLGETVTFSADVEADAVALAMKNIFVKLGRFSAPCEVLINGAEIGKIDGEHLSYILDTAGELKEGSNKISFRFETKNDPRDIGVFCAPQIIRFNNAIIDKVSLSQKHEGGTVTVAIQVDLLGNADNVRAVATLTSPVGQMYYAGLTRGSGSVVIPDPLYWYPHGYGVQNLYKVTVNLYGDVDIEDSVEMRIGLRTIDMADSGGCSINVNGISVLPMGAVYRAERDLSVPENKKRIEAFITYAAIANYNTVVIPADSPRPEERFYELCDLYGIMIIEELDKISDGYLDTLAKTSIHPSLCLIDLLNRANISEVLHSLNLVAPELYFSITEKFSEYYSHPSFPHIKTIDSAVPKELQAPTTVEMERISDSETTGKILCGIIERYPYPTSIEAISYASQLASANKITDKLKELRLSEGKHGRVVFDCLGDSKAISSSSAIDSATRRKALNFYLQKAFATISIYADYNDGKVTFSASSQRKLDLEGTLEYRIADAKNVTIYRSSEAVSLEGMTVNAIASLDISDYIRGHEQEYYLEYSLRDGSSILLTDVLLFVPEKHFAFEDPQIAFEISGSNKRFSVTLTPKAFAKDVEMYFEGVDAVFSSNYINLTQNSPVKFAFSTTGELETATQLCRALKIRSIYDVK